MMDSYAAKLRKVVSTSNQELGWAGDVVCLCLLACLPWTPDCINPSMRIGNAPRGMVCLFEKRTWQGSANLTASMLS